MVTSDVRIEERRADDPDASALIASYMDELCERLGAFEAGRSVSAEPDEMAPPRGTFVVLLESGRPVGCGGLKTLEPGVGEIKRMFVEREARGRGYGRRLLDALEQAARSLGHRRIVLDTAAPLLEAGQLYLSAGYQAIAPYNDNPYASHWFTKAL